MARVLVVDADRAEAQALDDHLTMAGFDVMHEQKGEDAIRVCHETHVDLVVVDMKLRDMTGTELCRLVRGERVIRGLPIILISDRAEEIDRVVAFEVGADDFVPKPYSLRELALRVRAVLRRRASRPHALHDGQLGGLELDTMAHRVSVDGTEVTLSPLEFKLLFLLRSRHNRVLSRGELLGEVWRHADGVSERTVDACIKRLRAKLGRAGAVIQTVRGVGYRFLITSDPSEAD